jgi:REP element-mobilizing transposase RayT
MARVIVPGHPHHIAKRGNRRQPTFFCDEDYTGYLEPMAEWCANHGVEIWACCLMPDHTHLIAVPSSEAGLRLAVGEAHRRDERMKTSCLPVSEFVHGLSDLPSRRLATVPSRLERTEDVHSRI